MRGLVRSTVLTGLVAALSSPAMGLVIPNVAWSDDFESYTLTGGFANPDRLRNFSPPWAGTGPENKVGEWPAASGNQAVRMTGFAGNGTTSNEYQLASFAAGMGDGATQVQAMTFTLQSDTTIQGTGNHSYIYFEDTNGTPLGYWFGWSGNMAPRSDVGGASVGPAIDITDGAVHEFSILYDPATGVISWLHNDVLHWQSGDASVAGQPFAPTLATGLLGERMPINDFSNNADHLYLDNMVAGYIPEPTSFLLLGIGALPLIRNRRRTRS